MQKRIVNAIITLVLLTGCAAKNPFKDSPNIILILADDMDLALMPYMERTNRLIGEQGATLDNYFVTTPICCPSRASMLRGQYAHNTDILQNTPGFARFYKLDEEKDTLNVWLQGAGYRTALFGKYLNNYPVNAGRNYVPPGWTDWAAFIANRDEGNFFYDYVMNENGSLAEYGDSPEDYSTDVILEKSLAFIESSVAADSPFFLFVSVYAPHGPAIPAARHEALDYAAAYPQKPSFNEADLSDKPRLIQRLASGGDEFDEDDASVFFQGRVRSLQAVDELVETLVQTLEQNGELDDTYIVFASDNGFHLGEHGLPSGKGTAYEEDIRAPFMMRGPGIEPGITVSQAIANIDFAPTVAEIAGVAPPDFVDGRSFLPFLSGGEAPWREGILIEFGYIDEEAISEALSDPEGDNLLMGIAGGAFRGIRGADYVYVEYANDEVEFYDLTADPHQLENLAGRLNAETLAQLHAKLDALKICEAETCRALEQDLKIEFR
ncbi:MAG: Choline-sulfatase [Anaerolineales bacterium]|nr:Choline-sulfatase [Anaerolineales bacterium]